MPMESRLSNFFPFTFHKAWSPPKARGKKIGIVSYRIKK